MQNKKSISKEKEQGNEDDKIFYDFAINNNNTNEEHDLAKEMENMGQCDWEAKGYKSSSSDSDNMTNKSIIKFQNFPNNQKSKII